MKIDIFPRRLATLAAALLLAVPAWAHHSFAMFDFGKTVTLKGTIKEFQWTNPHVVLYVLADGAPGTAPQEWVLELTSPGNLTRGGWNRHAFNAGDKVEIELSPLRDGTNGGAFRQGKILGSGQVWSSNLKGAEKPGLD